jgi:protein-S-isoprenylcysteine O-methyltransferase Ste14
MRYRRAMPSTVLVALQVAALAMVMWPWRSPSWNALAWLPLAAALLLKAWTIWHNRPGNFSVLPEPRANARLVTTGPYAYVRHPLYFALQLFAFACALGWNTPVHWAAAGALAVVLHQKALREESLLHERFPEYRAYAVRTRRFIPFVL